jgi:ATP-dependent Clp protease ATP-binding subunit ClpC
VIIFNSLSKKDLYKIIDISLNKLYDKANEMGYIISFTGKAKDFLIEKGYDPKYGARPLDRAIQKYLEDVLAEEILNGELKKGDSIIADYDIKKKTIFIKKTKTKAKSKRDKN